MDFWIGGLLIPNLSNNSLLPLADIMCKGTWVCFRCRTAVRRDTWRLVTQEHPELIGDTGVGRVKCPHCRGLCHFLGPSISIPPKRNLRIWDRLESDVMRIRQENRDYRKKVETKKKHDIERRVRDLKSRAPNAERSTVIKKLQKELPC